MYLKYLARLERDLIDLYRHPDRIDLTPYIRLNRDLISHLHQSGGGPEPEQLDEARAKLASAKQFIDRFDQSIESESIQEKVGVLVRFLEFLDQQIDLPHLETLRLQIEEISGSLSRTEELAEGRIGPVTRLNRITEPVLTETFPDYYQRPIEEQKRIVDHVSNYLSMNAEQIRKSFPMFEAPDSPPPSLPPASPRSPGSSGRVSPVSDPGDSPSVLLP